MNTLLIETIPFKILATKEKITIADSFVLRQNKIGSGNGEAKLYVGNDNEETRSFFGMEEFQIKCFLLKKDLLKYLEDTKSEYLKPEQPYINRELLPQLWVDRKQKIESLPEKIEFIVSEQSQIAGPRVYVNSSDAAYKLIRELSLPNITYISILKLINEEGNGECEFYFRLFADYFGDSIHPYQIEQDEQIIASIEDEEERFNQSKARKGQGKYRADLLALCPYCPITLISDDRLLIASHIKPWRASDNFEKTDPYNGFMLSPAFDFLFDRGFMSFTDDKKTILSPFLSNMTYSKLGISDGKTISHLPVEGRELYLEFHRNEVLKK